MTGDLLDTHICLAIVGGRLAARYPVTAARLRSEDAHPWVSAVSLWEIAIKVRLGKLNAGMDLDDLPQYLTKLGMKLLPIEVHHVLADVTPKPPTRDPFDNLLLAQCQMEGFRLVTADGALKTHPLALAAS